MTSVGIWCWTVAKCLDGDVNAIVQKCRDVGIGHFLVKTNDGRQAYNGTLQPLVNALRAAQINVWSWAYTYGVAAEDEADAFAARSAALGITALCVDAEVEYKTHPNRAIRYMDRLRAKAGDEATIAMSSYYLPKNHPTFPWKEFYNRADIAMPQVYWYTNDPVLAVTRSLAQHVVYTGRAGSSIPVIPVGAAYPEAAGSSMNLRRFLHAVEQAGIGQTNFWSFQHALDSYWEEIRTFTHREEEV